MGAIAARDPKDVVFITDAVAEPTPGKTYDYGKNRVMVVTENAECCQLVGTTTIAGSCTNLNTTLKILV